MQIIQIENQNPFKKLNEKSNSESQVQRKNPFIENIPLNSKNDDLEYQNIDEKHPEEMKIKNRRKFEEGNEVITIHLGQTGTNIGLEFWQNLISEKLLFNDNSKYEDIMKEYKPIFFNESSTRRPCPRTIFIDYDSYSHNNILEEFGPIFPSSCFIYNENENMDSASYDYNSLNHLFREKIKESLRFQLESCSSLQGFLIFHSACGNAGRYLGEFFHEIVEDLPLRADNVNIPIYSITPEKNSEIDTINQLMTTIWLDKYSTFVLPLELNALVNRINELSFKRLPDSGSENQFIADIVSNLTYCIRIKHKTNYTLQSLIQSIITDNNHKFISSNIASFFESTTSSYLMNPKDLIYHCFTNTSLTKGNLKLHKFSRNLIILDGRFEREFEEEIKRIFRISDKSGINISNEIINEEKVKYIIYNSNKDWTSNDFKIVFCSNSSSISTFFKDLMIQDKSFFDTKKRNQMR